jgi:hypothetical protein
MKRFLLKVEGPKVNGLGEIELPRLPRKGDPLDTALGAGIVTAARPLPEPALYAGKIVCRVR